MRLKRLTVHGFKSFADRTEFAFDQDLTGIVGPNGCGKSNVVDALKWVLGDQRARSLRGTEMTDVIFKGAEGRSALPKAEVEILLEDGSGRFGERREVVIGRRLTVEKESDYLLNGDPVRLKDVRDLLMDTGLGVGAYSVMEQGRIDAVLSANPEERRSIFEEAAGISRFKLQKRESLRKLERTEQNLSRVHDLLEERARRIRSLKIQAGKARRWQEIWARLRDLEVALAWLEACATRALQQEQADRMAGLGQQMHEAEARRQEIEDRIAALDEEIRAKRAVVEDLQNEVHRAATQAHGHEERAAGLQRKLAEQDGVAADADQKVLVLDGQRQQRQAELQAARARIEQLEAELVELGRRGEELREALKQAQRVARERADAREHARQAVLESLHERAQCNNQVLGSEEKRRHLRSRIEATRVRVDALAGELAKVQEEDGGLALVGEDLAQRAAVLAGEEGEAIAALATADAEAAERAREAADLRSQLSSIEGRLAVLAEMESHLEGIDSGPRWLLESGAPGLRGRLADLLDVDLELSPALEAALGPYQQALVVDTRENAFALLQLLREQRKGRAMLLVESEFSPELERMAPVDPPEGARALAGLVRCPESARPLLGWLLRGVCLVDDVATVPLDRPDLLFVSRDGNLRCGPRVEGGRGEVQGGLIVRRAQMIALRQQVAEVQARLDAMLAASAAAGQRAGEVRELVQRLGSALQGVRAKEQDNQNQRHRLQARDGDMTRELDTLGLERAELQRDEAACCADLATHLLGLHLLDRRHRLAVANEADAVRGHQEAQQALQDATQQEQGIRVQHVDRARDREGVRNTIRVQEQALLDLEATARELASRGDEARRAAEEARQERDKTLEQAAVLRERAAGLEQARDGASAELAAWRTRQDEERAALQSVDRSRAELTEAMTQCRIEQTNLEHRFARAEDHLRETTRIELRRVLGEIEGFGLVCDELVGPPPPDEVDVLHGPPLPPALLAEQSQYARLWEQDGFVAEPVRSEAEGLRAQIERLGPVNLGAVRELEDEEKDYAFLQKEVEDLTESRKALIEALRKMEAESRALFEKTFEEARHNFQAIFRKLFQGGRADMTLVPPEENSTGDALEAGIHIVAQPPGKQLQSINLLSGGERSLTALAILFAVFKVKPSPFCILDEVDAALDETNVERFLRVLRDFVGPTQFCIVTHHKRTMAACQVLYGITMQKRGVSSRIAVNLEEVDSLKAPGAPGAVDAEGLAVKQRIAGEEALGF
ncbi:MAG: chromosome segregation protein SMC [Planctomycetes bacterium]|nr:chromosome segregation protein SMC [Planctomycetota bacterium]